MIEMFYIFNVSISVPGCDTVLYFLLQDVPSGKTSRVYMGSHYFLQLHLNLKRPQVKTLNENGQKCNIQWRRMMRKYKPFLRKKITKNYYQQPAGKDTLEIFGCIQNNPGCLCGTSGLHHFSFIWLFPFIHIASFPFFGLLLFKYPV